IILQHQFWGLEVEKNSFSVTLSFNDRHERISIPFEAITSFADPAVKFGLRFEAQDHPASKAAEANTVEPASAAAQSTGSETAQGEGANVAPLETFRKKGISATAGECDPLPRVPPVTAAPASSGRVKMP